MQNFFILLCCLKGILTLVLKFWQEFVQDGHFTTVFKQMFVSGVGRTCGENEENKELEFMTTTNDKI